MRDMAEIHKEHEKKERELMNIIFIAGFIWALTALLAGNQINANTELTKSNQILTDSITKLNKELSAVDSSFQRQAQINLHLRGEKSDSEEKDLRANKKYMELVTPRTK